MTETADAADTGLSEFDRALLAFRDVQHRWADYGACDTEPRWVFERLIDDLHAGLDVHVPTTARGWQLFTGEGMRGNGLAATALARAAGRAVEAARRDTVAVARFARGF